MNGRTYTIIIVGYNAPDLVERCLQSIVLHGSLGNSTQEVCLVKNSSEAIDTSHIPKKYLRVIQNDSNVGFGQAVNWAAQRAQSSHLILLNQDAELQEDTMLALDAFLSQHKNAGVVGLRQQKHSGEILATIGNFPNVLRELAALTGVSRLLPVGRLIHARGLTARLYREARKQEWVSGGAMVIRRDLFREIKGFDPDYFMYVEDVDLCRRISDAGESVWFCDSAIVWHDGGPTNDQRALAQSETTHGLSLYARKYGLWAKPIIIVEKVKGLLRKVFA